MQDAEEAAIPGKERIKPTPDQQVLDAVAWGAFGIVEIVVGEALHIAVWQRFALGIAVGGAFLVGRRWWKDRQGTDVSRPFGLR